MSKTSTPTTSANTLFPKSSRAYFDAAKVAPSIVTRYVAWLDLMGARGIMGRSLAKAINFVGKIHDAVLTSRDAMSLAAGHSLEVYPVIDGAYITSSHRSTLDDFVYRAMLKLASTFIHENNNEHRFLVRGGIALGNVVEGASLIHGSDSLGKSASYAQAVAIGSAIGQAYEAENQAPPFGLCVDITARSISINAEPTYLRRFHRWWEMDKAKGTTMAAAMKKPLLDYFDWMKGHLHELEYPEESFKKHRALVEEYFN